MAWLTLPALIPCISGLALMALVKGSINSVKNESQKGCSCLQPLQTGKPSAVLIDVGYWVKIEDFNQINKIRA